MKPEKFNYDEVLKEFNKENGLLEKVAKINTNEKLPVKQVDDNFEKSTFTVSELAKPDPLLQLTVKKERMIPAGKLSHLMFINEDNLKKHKRYQNEEIYFPLVPRRAPLQLVEIQKVTNPNFKSLGYIEGEPTVLPSILERDLGIPNPTAKEQIVSRLKMGEGILDYYGQISDNFNNNTVANLIQESHDFYEPHEKLLQRTMNEKTEEAKQHIKE